MKQFVIILVSLIIGITILNGMIVTNTDQWLFTNIALALFITWMLFPFEHISDYEIPLRLVMIISPAVVMLLAVSGIILQYVIQVQIVGGVLMLLTLIVALSRKG